MSPKSAPSQRTGYELHMARDRAHRNSQNFDVFGKAWLRRLANLRSLTGG